MEGQEMELVIEVVPTFETRPGKRRKESFFNFLKSKPQGTQERIGGVEIQHRHSDGQTVGGKGAGPVEGKSMNRHRNGSNNGASWAIKRNSGKEERQHPERSEKSFITASVVREHTYAAVGLTLARAQKKKALLIAKIDPNGLFADTPLRVGDELLTVNNTAVGLSKDDAISMIRKISGPITILARGYRGNTLSQNGRNRGNTGNDDCSMMAAKDNLALMLGRKAVKPRLKAIVLSDDESTVSTITKGSTLTSASSTGESTTRCFAGRTNEGQWDAACLVGACSGRVQPFKPSDYGNSGGDDFYSTLDL